MKVGTRSELPEMSFPRGSGYCWVPGVPMKPPHPLRKPPWRMNHRGLLQGSAQEVPLLLPIRQGPPWTFVSITGWRKVLGPGPQPSAVLLAPTAPSMLSSQPLFFSPPLAFRRLGIIRRISYVFSRAEGYATLPERGISSCSISMTLVRQNFPKRPPKASFGLSYKTSFKEESPSWLQQPMKMLEVGFLQPPWVPWDPGQLWRRQSPCVSATVRVSCFYTPEELGTGSELVEKVDLCHSNPTEALGHPQPHLHVVSSNICRTRKRLLGFSLFFGL